MTTSVGSIHIKHGHITVIQGTHVWDEDVWTDDLGIACDVLLARLNVLYEEHLRPMLRAIVAITQANKED